MNSWKNNLLIRFSVASFVIVFILVVVFSFVLTKQLDRNIELLKDHRVAEISGTAILVTDPYSIPSLIQDVSNLQRITLGGLAAGFVYVYGAFFLVVRRGWKTMRTERTELESLNTQLGDQVTANFAELQEANKELQREIRERSQAEEALRDSNLRLEEACTDLRETQQQITQQERMRAMGQMASGVAHDFNNTLSPIVAYCDLLIEIPNALDNKEEALGRLRTIRTAAQDATHMVKRLREFYRPAEHGKFSKAISVNDVIEESIILTQPKWRDQAQVDGVTIIIETDLQEVPPVLGINPSDLREVLVNLILNAIDAMPDGGAIIIRTQREEKWVTVEVEDTGSGMTEEIRQRCLEPFFTTKGERGSGLGLSMVYGIVQRLGGTIDIDTELGKGTKFILHLLYLTAAPVESNPTFSTNFSPSPPSDLRILAVDDDAASLQALCQLLRASGHIVETAANGQEGLEIFRAGNYDLVITDRAMPEMNGDQLAASIRELRANQRMIMLSGFGHIMAGTDDRPSNVDLVVSKPVTLAMLRAALAKVMAE